MKIIITKQQYKKLVYNLLDTVTGGELVVSENRRETIGYVNVFNSYGDVVMNIFDMKGYGRSKGCKKDLALDSDFVIELDNYVPYFKHKIFSKVLVDYVYDKTGVKCDCVDYPKDYKKEDPNLDHGYFDSRFVYNVKKKKRIGESSNERKSLDEIIYNFLEDDYYPDYNWGPELFDFYKEDVEEYGSHTFYINDDESYTYYKDGVLEIMPSVSEKLDEWFNDSWMPVFKKWFEEHSGLKVKKIVTMDGVVKLNESMDKKQNVFSDQSSNNSIFMFNQTGTKGYYQAIPFSSFPDEFYNYVSSLGKDSESEVMDYLINRTYIEASGEYNRVHFREGIHPKLQGIGLGYTIYKDFINFLGYGSSSENATRESKRVWEKLLESSDFYGVYGDGDNVLIASKNWKGDVASLFKSFISKKCQGRVIKISNSLLSDYPEFNSYFKNSINESINKNKKLLNGIIGFDFTGIIKQIKSTYDVPMSFDDCLGGDSIKRYLNFWGPMYLFELDGIKYVYQDRGEYKFFMDEGCIEYVDNEISEKLGIDILGLRFSDIIDMYFNEEE